MNKLTRYRGVMAKVRSASSKRLSTGSRTMAGYGQLQLTYSTLKHNSSTMLSTLLIF